MVGKGLCLALLLVLALAATAWAGQKEQEALRSARAWLALVDAGRYQESWSRAAALLKRAVPLVTWQRQLKAVREPLGKVKSRRLLTASYRRSLPGAPDGHYVVIQFQTSFSRKKQAVETVTPLRGADGAWRVAGYYIK